MLDGAQLCGTPKYLPDWERAVIKFSGPSTQQTRQPGRRQFWMKYDHQQWLQKIFIKWSWPWWDHRWWWQSPKKRWKRDQMNIIGKNGIAYCVDILDELSRRDGPSVIFILRIDVPRVELQSTESTVFQTILSEFYAPRPKSRWFPPCL